MNSLRVLRSILANTISILNEKVKHLSFIRNSNNYYSIFQITKCVDICVCVGAIQFNLGQLKWLNNTHMVNSLVRPVKRKRCWQGICEGSIIIFTPRGNVNVQLPGLFFFSLVFFLFPSFLPFFLSFCSYVRL